MTQIHSSISSVSFAEQLAARLDPLLARAKSSDNAASEWAPLARKHWVNDLFAAEFCRRYSSTGKADDALWYDALARYASLSDRQVNLLREAWRALRSKAMSAAKSAFSQQELVSWSDKFLSPCITAFREAIEPGEKREAARALLSPRWKKDVHYSTFITRYGGDSSWYDALQTYFDLSAAERELIESAARDRARIAASEANRRHSLEDLCGWVQAVLMPLLENARRTGDPFDWSKLAPARWKREKKCRAFCYAFAPGRNRTDLGGALNALCGLSPEEQKILAKNGYASRGIVRRRRHTEGLRDPVERFRCKELLPLVEEARASEPAMLLHKWEKLRAGLWQDHELYRSFCLLYTGKAQGWAEALTSAFDLTFYEQYLVRRLLPGLAGARARSLKPRIVDLRTDNADTDARPEASLLESALEENGGRLIIPKPASTLLGWGKVLKHRGKRRVASHVQRMRARVSTVVREGSSFDRIRDEFIARQREMLPRHTTTLGVRFLIQQARLDPSFPWPGRVLSAGSGAGTLFSIVQSLRDKISAQGLTIPEIIDLDISQEMLDKSANPNRLCGNMGDMPESIGQVDAVECSSLASVTPVIRAAFLLQASKVLRVGGLLWLKIDRAYFDPIMSHALDAAGFQSLMPINTELLLVPKSSGISKVPSACYRARFAFLIKQYDANPKSVYALLKLGAFALARKPRMKTPRTDPTP